MLAGAFIVLHENIIMYSPAPPCVSSVMGPLSPLRDKAKQSGVESNRKAARLAKFP
jgi:hypothetical protein